MFNADLSIRGLIITLLFLTTALSATNKTPHYPLPINKYISDYTGVLQPVDRLSITSTLNKHEKNSGIESSVVIIDSINSYAPGVSLESFTTNLFNKWGIGNRSKNNGVLLLVALQDRKVRIELGAGYGKAHEKVAAEIINSTMLPLFKQGKITEAIMAGSNAIIKAIATQPSSPWVWYLIILGLIFFGIIAFFSLREALLHDTSYGFTAKDTGRSWLYYSLFGVSKHNRNQKIRSRYSGYTGSSFSGGRSSGGGASGGW